MAALTLLVALPAPAKAHIPWEAAKAPQWWLNATEDLAGTGEAPWTGEPGCDPYGYEYEVESEIEFDFDVISKVEWRTKGTDSGTFPAYTSPCNGYYPSGGVICSGEVTHAHTSSNQPPRGTFTCGATYRDISCGRSTYTGPNGEIEDDSGWSDDFAEPYYCLPDIPGWTGGPDVPPLNEKCEQAKRKVERAKKRVRQADTASAKQKAKKKLKSARKKRDAACGIEDARRPRRQPR